MTNVSKEARLWLTTIVLTALVITNEKFQDRCEITYNKVKGFIDNRKKKVRKKNK